MQRYPKIQAVRRVEEGNAPMAASRGDVFEALYLEVGHLGSCACQVLTSLFGPNREKKTKQRLEFVKWKNAICLRVKDFKSFGVLLPCARSVKVWPMEALCFLALHYDVFLKALFFPLCSSLHFYSVPFYNLF